MAREHGRDLYDLDIMTDEEIRALVVQQLGEYPNVDATSVDVSVRDGFVTLTGRVGTDSELQVTEAILHDVIGVERYQNDLVVSELERGQAPAGADEEVVEDEVTDDPLGEPLRNQSDTAEHLVEDLESETYGTHDVGEAIQDGVPYVPPDRPIAEGYRSREDH